MLVKNKKIKKIKNRYLRIEIESAYGLCTNYKQRPPRKKQRGTKKTGKKHVYSYKMSIKDKIRSRRDTTPGSQGYKDMDSME